MLAPMPTAMEAKEVENLNNLKQLVEMNTTKYGIRQ